MSSLKFSGARSKIALIELCFLIKIILLLFQGKMVLALSKEPSPRLLKHVVRCYLRLSDNPRYFCLYHLCYLSNYISEQS